MVFAVAFPPRKTGKLLKHCETLALSGRALKLTETFGRNLEIFCHALLFRGLQDRGRLDNNPKEQLDLSRLRARMREKPRTKAGQVRQAWPEIKELFAAGHSLKDIWIWLNEIGIEIGYARLSHYIGQIRRREEAGESGGGQQSFEESSRFPTARPLDADAENRRRPNGRSKNGPAGQRPGTRAAAARVQLQFGARLEKADLTTREGMAKTTTSSETNGSETYGRYPPHTSRKGWGREKSRRFAAGAVLPRRWPGCAMHRH